jgi:alpha-tubulin suppressor-like RCC1 family protein
VAAGHDHACAISAANGSTANSLWCWGYNLTGQLGDGTHQERWQPVRVGTKTDWTSTSAGFTHTCGVRADGQAWCWGDNGWGEVGDGTGVDRSVPVKVDAPAGWVQIDTHFGVTCGLRSDHSGWCWGWNSQGQLGDGTLVSRLAPVRISGNRQWSVIATGCGVTEAKSQLYCWGLSGVGGTYEVRVRPTHVESVRGL